MTRPLRILHIETRHRRGGAERNVLHTAMWELSAGHAVTLAVGADSLVDDVTPDVEVELVPSLVRNVNPRRDLEAVVSLRRLIRRGRFDIVHTHQSKAGVVGRLAARGLTRSIVHTVHMASFGPSYSRTQSGIFLRAERYAAVFTDAIVSVGSELRDLYVAAGVGRPEKHLVIHSPIDIEMFARRRTASARQRRAAKKSFGIDPDANLVVAIASLEPRKRIDLLVRSVAELVHRGVMTLAIAGDGAQRATIEQLIAELGLESGVRLLGHVEHPAELLLAADALAHASTVEGVPQVVIQALAAGVPVVVTPVIGLGEIPDAPVRIVASDASDIGTALRDVLDRPPVPVDLRALRPWTAPMIDDQLAALHARLRTAN